MRLILAAFGLALVGCGAEASFIPSTQEGFPSKPAHLVQIQPEGDVPPNARLIGTITEQTGLTTDNDEDVLAQAGGDAGCDLVASIKKTGSSSLTAGCYVYQQGYVRPADVPATPPASTVSSPEAWTCDVAGGCYPSAAACQAAGSGGCAPTADLFCRAVGDDATAKACYATQSACRRGEGKNDFFPAAACQRG